MITKIRNLVNTAFFSKHVNIKPGARITKMLGQIISGLTAYYALQSFLGIDNPYLNTTVAILLALLPEIIIHYYGWGAMLPLVEYIGGQKAYQVESEVQNLSKWLNGIKIGVFLVALSATTYFTVKGSFQYGYDRKDPGQAPDKTAIIEQQKKEGVSEYDRLNAASLKKQELFVEQINNKKKTLTEEKDFASKEWKRYNQEKNWTANTTKAHRLLNKGGLVKLENQISELEAKLSNSYDATALLAAKMDSTARAEGLTAYDAQKDQHQDKVDEAQSSGWQIFFIGLLGQFFVVFSLFAIVMIEVGSGTVKDRSRHYLDGIHVWAERFKIWKYRRREAAVYKLAKWSKQPLEVSKKRIGLFASQKEQIDNTNPENFDIFYLTAGTIQAAQEQKLSATNGITSSIMQQLIQHENNEQQSKIAHENPHAIKGTRNSMSLNQLKQRLKDYKKRVGHFEQKAIVQKRQNGEATKRTLEAIQNNKQWVQHYEDLIKAALAEKNGTAPKVLPES